jgi:hypothetical protein
MHHDLTPVPINPKHGILRELERQKLLMRFHDLECTERHDWQVENNKPLNDLVTPREIAGLLGCQALGAIQLLPVGSAIDSCADSVNGSHYSSPLNPLTSQYRSCLSYSDLRTDSGHEEPREHRAHSGSRASFMAGAGVL